MKANVPAGLIEHLIILTMENRSFDHFLGGLAIQPNPMPVEGLVDPPRSVPSLDGNPISNWCMDDLDPNIPDVPHCYPYMHDDYNNTKNDGFVKSFQKANPGAPRLDIPMGYYTAKKLPVLYALAAEFTVCDRWFASILSSTWPNRKYLLSGRRDNDNDTQTVPGVTGFQTTPIYDYIETRPNMDNGAPGQPLTWKCYFTDVPFLAFWYKFAAFHALRNFSTIEKFVDDCREDALPTISVIDPPFTLADDHPPHDPVLGEKFIGLVVDALTNSESWRNSTLVILFDEGGGFHDHVAPPPAPEPNPVDTPLGFRVPALIISPYAKKRYVSSVDYDHTTVMRSIAERWEVPFDHGNADFGTRWKYAKSIWSDCFDFSAQPRPSTTYTGAPITSVNWGTGVRERLGTPMGSFESLLERVFVLPELKALDRRASSFETLAQLEQKVIALKRTVNYSPSP